MVIVFIIPSIFSTFAPPKVAKALPSLCSGPGFSLHCVQPKRMLKSGATLYSAPNGEDLGQYK